MKLFPALFCLLLPAAAAAAPRALLWLPDGAAGAGEIFSLLEKEKDLRLTAALGELPAELEARALKLEAAGRLEPALRPAGDPPLPLLYYPGHEAVRWEGKPSTGTLPSGDQHFLSLRLGLARDAAQRRYRKVPAGLVSPPGGLVPDVFPLARALGVRWLACGPAASTAAAVFTAEGLHAVPFSPFLSSASAGPFLVFDETLAPDPAALRRALAEELQRSAAEKEKLLTVAEALRTAVSTPAAAADISLLTGPWPASTAAPAGYARWAAAPHQAGALAALAAARADLMLHLNAAGGDYAAARAAFEEYFAAEDGPRLAALASPEPEVSAEADLAVRTALGGAYRRMGKAPPPWVYTSLSDAGTAPAAADKLQVELSTSGFTVTNTAARPRFGAAPARLPGSADPYRVWKLEKFSVEVSPEAVVFRLYPGQVDNSRRFNSGFSHLHADVYIDINRRPRAGKLSPLTGRPLRLFPENAWEYALEITPAGAALYSAAAVTTDPVAAVKPKVENGAVTVRLPRSALRGNPLLWGYAALALAPAGENNFEIADSVAEGVANGYIYAVFPGRQ